MCSLQLILKSWAFSPRTLEGEPRWIYEDEASMVYGASSRTDRVIRVTQRSSALKNKTKQKINLETLFQWEAYFIIVKDIKIYVLFKYVCESV